MVECAKLWEKVLLEQLLNVMAPELKIWVTERKPKTLGDRTQTKDDSGGSEAGRRLHDCYEDDDREELEGEDWRGS